ncbi:hypothetical protein ACFFWD_26235 [Bradyrhizobium erythrophlei]|uniref:hypothetical protein n=1 Tax=Bradyrhizobium erythrophlei TaxID=1437360 RepID=UPI0035E83ADC
MDEVVDDLALGGDWVRGDRVDEIADEVSGRYWIWGNVEMEVMDEAADQQALGCDWVLGERVDEIADKMTEIEAGIWHDDFPFLKVRVPVVDFPL